MNEKKARKVMSRNHQVVREKRVLLTLSIENGGWKDPQVCSEKNSSWVS